MACRAHFHRHHRNESPGSRCTQPARPLLICQSVRPSLSLPPWHCTTSHHVGKLRRPRNTQHLTDNNKPGVVSSRRSRLAEGMARAVPVSPGVSASLMGGSRERQVRGAEGTRVPEMAWRPEYLGRGANAYRYLCCVCRACTTQ